MPKWMQQLKKLPSALCAAVRKGFASARSRFSAHWNRHNSRVSARFRHRTVRGASFSYRLKMFLLKAIGRLEVFFSAVGTFFAPFVFPFLIVVLIGACIFAVSRYTVAVAVTLGDENVAYVKNQAEYMTVSAAAENSVRNLLAETGEEDTLLLEDFPLYSYSVIPRDRLTGEEALYETIYNRIYDYTKKSYGFYLNGELLATNKDKTVFDLLIETLLPYYGADEETQAEVLDHIQIVRGEFDARYEKSYSQLLALFISNRDGASYTVSAGDTLQSISKKTGISVPALCLTNTVFPDHVLTAGQVLTIGNPQYLMTVKTVKSVVSTQVTPFETNYSYSDSLYEGTRRVLVAGVDGLTEITTANIYVNGILSSSAVLGTEPLRGAVKQEVLIGTVPVAPSGKFIWPLKNYQFVSSEFGWRWLRGSRDYHRGLDIAAKYGTSIYAADAGTVCDMGWDSYGLGWFVRIDHGNGIETVYGHCSSIDSNMYIGKPVYQGEVLARVGSTGNATGNHLHFAVYVQESKTYVDPSTYLSIK